MARRLDFVHTIASLSQFPVCDSTHNLIIIRSKLHVCLYVCMLNEWNCLCVCVGVYVLFSRHRVERSSRQRVGRCSRQRHLCKQRAGRWQRVGQRHLCRQRLGQREAAFWKLLGVLILAACVSHWCLSCMCVYICGCIVRCLRLAPRWSRFGSYRPNVLNGRELKCRMQSKLELLRDELVLPESVAG